LLEATAVGVLVVLVASLSAAAAVAVMPARLAGTYVSRIGNYPEVGLYAGRYKLTFGPRSTVGYTVPGEPYFTLPVTVAGNRITFLPGGACPTRGTYVWNVDGATLTFRKVKDTCPKRVITMARRWKRIT
jgi:hypothetical protein